MAIPSGVPVIRTDLAHYGRVTQVINATQFVASGLAGLGEGALVNYQIYVLVKNDGSLTAPRGEQQPITAYVSSSGAITHPAFTVNLAVGDTILALHPTVAGTALLTVPRSLDFWSDPQEEVQLGAAAATLTLPDVVVAGLPAGATVVRAIAFFKWRMTENTNAAVNNLNGATVPVTSQVIQVRDSAPGTWRDAIEFADNMFNIAATTRESGDVQIGNVDISVEVTGDGTYEFQWLLSRAAQDNLNFNDVQVGLRIYYTM